MRSKQSQIKGKKKAQRHTKHFYQFNTKVTPQLLYKLADRPLAMKVLAVILYSANELGAVVIKQKYIREAVAKRTKEANNSSVVSAIHYLRSLGVLAVCKKDVRNAYIINPNFIWRLPSKSDKRYYILKNKHIHFDANPLRIRKNKTIKNKLIHARSNASQLVYTDLKRLIPKKPVKSYYEK